MGSEIVAATHYFDTKKDCQDDLISVSDGSIRGSVDVLQSIRYEMALPIPMDVAVGLAYLFGAVGALLLLITENKNDFVRFHAWQSFLVFFTILCFQLVVSFYSAKLLYILTTCSILLSLCLSIMAYKTSPSLKVFYLPIIGQIAAAWVASE